MDDLLFEEQTIEYHEVKDFRLHTIFNELSKKELVNLSKFYRIAHVSHMKRGELQNIVENDVHTYIAKLLKLLNDNHLEEIHKLLSDEFIPIDEGAPLPLKYRFLLNYGIIYPIRYQEISGLILPREIKKTIVSNLTEELMLEFDRNNRIIALANDCMHLYGLIEYQSLNYLYQQAYPDDDFVPDFKDILLLESQFSETYLCEEEYLYYPKIDRTLFRFLEMRKQVKDLDYYQYLYFTEDPLSLQDEYVVDRLRKSIKQMSHMEQNRLLNLTIDYLNYGYTLEMAKERLASEMAPKAHKKLFNRFSKVHDELRLWVYRGHRLKDL